MVTFITEFWISRDHNLESSYLQWHSFEEKSNISATLSKIIESGL